jgi:Zn-dependent peptidase ImmA (M78 family)/transcriptional regulator with XRE-family HTH domain
MVMDGPAFDRNRLRIARELAGSSQAQLAQAVGLTPAALSQFESGAARPSPETLARLSITLRVPAAFFEQPMIETHEGFFRSLRRTAVADRRRARAVAHLAHDLATHATATGHFPPLSLPSIPVSGLEAPATEVERIAVAARSVYRLPPGPIDDMVRLLEDHGVVVIRLPLGTADVDAFSLPFPDHPVAVLGTDKNDRARSRFDAAHELGHLVMHGEQIWGMAEIEKQAHSFAAALLMPADQIYPELPNTVDWPRLFDLKRRWQVSLAALLMRARTLGRMTEATYLTAIKAASARGWRRVEPVPLGDPEEPRRLLTFIRSPTSKAVRETLPAHVVDDIARASIA